MPRWTRTEDLELIAAYQRGCLSRAALTDLLPGHTSEAIIEHARELGLKRRAQMLYWLRKAHLYFARRERGMLA